MNPELRNIILTAGKLQCHKTNFENDSGIKNYSRKKRTNSGAENEENVFTRPKVVQNLFRRRSLPLVRIEIISDTNKIFQGFSVEISCQNFMVRLKIILLNADSIRCRH